MHKTSKALLALAALTWVAPGCAKNKAPEPAAADKAAPEQESFGQLTIPELDAKIQAAKSGALKLFIYDNNSRERFEKSHLPGAKWINYAEYAASELPSDKDATLVFYCANEH
jgi:hypothetical protein